jgi:hypothetical protein
VSSIGADWNAFWFTPRESSTLTAFRIALGGMVLFWGLSFGPDLMNLYSETGILPEPDYNPARTGLFRWFEGDWALVGLYGVMLSSAVCVALGVFVRVAGPLMFVGVMSFQLDNVMVLNAGDQLLRVACAYFAIYALFTARGFGPTLGALLRSPSGDAEVAEEIFEPAPFWFIRLMQLQMTVIYPVSVISKLGGSEWLGGTATHRALQLLEYQRFPLPDFVTESLWVAHLFTWSTLALEFLLPVLLWNPKTRRFALILGVGLHLGFEYALRIGFFSVVMTLGYISFVTPSEATRLLASLRARRAG